MKKGKSRCSARKRMLQHQARHPHNDCPRPYDQHAFDGSDPDMDPLEES